jgi:hypothetical protein
MKIKLLALGILALALNASAADIAATPPPINKAEAALVLKIVSTERPPGQKERFTHEIFLQSTSFESLEKLKRHLATLPRGTRIEYDYSCLGIFTRPLAIYDDLEAFKKFCSKHGIELMLVYGTHKDRIKYLPK